MNPELLLRFQNSKARLKKMQRAESCLVLGSSVCISSKQFFTADSASHLFI